MQTYTINCSGKLIDFSQPKVMGILNVTPDSFFAESRKQSYEEIHRRVQQMVDEGAQMIDIGAYSSRPGADDVSPEEEMRRLSHGLQIVNKLVPQLPVSVDTFRADVARMAVEEYGADIINDISGGEMDAQMFRTIDTKQYSLHSHAHARNPPNDAGQSAILRFLTRSVSLYGATCQSVARYGRKGHYS